MRLDIRIAFIAAAVASAFATSTTTTTTTSTVSSTVTVTPTAYNYHYSNRDHHSNLISDFDGDGDSDAYKHRGRKLDQAEINLWGVALSTESSDIVKSGDTCNTIDTIYDIAFTDFLRWNPEVSTSCANLQPAAAYCVQATPACTKTYTVVRLVSGDTCGGIEETYGLTDAQLRFQTIATKTSSPVMGVDKNRVQSNDKSSPAAAAPMPRISHCMRSESGFKAAFLTPFLARTKCYNGRSPALVTINNDDFGAWQVWD
ncbi:uncharacterized protein C8Q71DRAFT_728129 [Rhodofomes roseus]|uniref:LysM domain-containing protein n=1 Tax=Rhodofomes roseus TaxID=34475 RepID=A0ABQ8JZA8_9APHY|nr:uncharacterized protein C8Q71DRAFT_728129 [Rhodofomes roseus]KAH9829384.1 hypothetical protein C8Q71DRAFT_728129 [Rhodofomes roseus]